MTDLSAQMNSTDHQLLKSDRCYHCKKISQQGNGLDSKSAEGNCRNALKVVGVPSFEVLLHWNSQTMQESRRSRKESQLYCMDNLSSVQYIQNSQIIEHALAGE